MSPISYQEAAQVLRRAGFVKTEIDRLYRLRQAYQMNAQDQPPLNLNRLLFVRWLIATGRLTDQLPEARGQHLLPLKTQGVHSRPSSPDSRFLLSDERSKPIFLKGMYVSLTGLEAERNKEQRSGSMIPAIPA